LVFLLFLYLLSLTFGFDELFGGSYDLITDEV